MKRKYILIAGSLFALLVIELIIYGGVYWVKINQLSGKYDHQIRMERLNLEKKRKLLLDDFGRIVASKRFSLTPCFGQFLLTQRSANPQFVQEFLIKEQPALLLPVVYCDVLKVFVTVPQYRKEGLFDVVPARPCPSLWSDQEECLGEFLYPNIYLPISAKRFQC